MLIITLSSNCTVEGNSKTFCTINLIREHGKILFASTSSVKHNDVRSNIILAKMSDDKLIQIFLYNASFFPRVNETHMSHCLPLHVCTMLLNTALPQRPDLLLFYDTQVISKL